MIDPEHQLRAERIAQALLAFPETLARQRRRFAERQKRLKDFEPFSAQLKITVEENRKKLERK